MAVTTTALILAGLESAKLLIKQFPDYDQRKARDFDADVSIYNIQKTLPEDHPDINDSLFLRVRHRLLKHVEEINKHASPDGKAS